MNTVVRSSLPKIRNFYTSKVTFVIEMETCDIKDVLRTCMFCFTRKTCISIDRDRIELGIIFENTFQTRHFLGMCCSMLVKLSLRAPYLGVKKPTRRNESVKIYVYVLYCCLWWWCDCPLHFMREIVVVFNFYVIFSGNVNIFSIFSQFSTLMLNWWCIADENQGPFNPT